MDSLFSLLFVLSLVLKISVVIAAPVKRFASSPAIPLDFPDPSIINANNNWYAFATTNGRYNVQIARSGDFNNWALLAKDALPSLAPWAQGPVWAPDVIQRVCLLVYIRHSLGC